MQKWSAVVLMTVVMLLSLPSFAAVSHDASLVWKTLNSEHFTIHFHQKGEDTAREVLALAESVHTRLAPMMQWQPSGPTEIVLSDEYDVANGYASPYPSNRMTLYMTAPDSLDGIEDHAGWMELVFTHEYLHILHLDKATGAPSVLRNIFGRFELLFPNALQPAWFIEGLATHVETDKSRGIGRGQSSYYDMLMRMEALNGMKPLRQVNQPLVSWPMGNVPYLYGVNFYQWLSQQYGEDKVAELVSNYSNNIVPFRIGSNAYQVTGKDIDTLWNEFSASVSTHYNNQASEITARGLDNTKRLTHDGYFADSLVAGSGQDIYYVGFDALHRTSLIRLRDGKAQRLTDLSFGARLSYHHASKLLVAQPEVCRDAALYYDLYRYDENGNGRERLTHCGRYRTAVWSQDGKSIFAVHNENGQSELHLLDADGKFKKVLWHGEMREVIGSMDASPDGKFLIASLWQPGQGWELLLFDIAMSQRRTITNTIAIEHQARFTPDGKRLVYSADYDGVYNIYSMDFTTSKIERITNVVGGAFTPLIMENDVVYAGYDASGFDIYRQVYQPRQEEISPTEGSGAIAATVNPQVTISKTADYSPLDSVRPRWWLPHAVIEESRSEVGVVTGGSDTLNRHLYAVDAAYDATNHYGVGSIDYIYDRWKPVFKLHADTNSDIELDDEGELIRIRRESSGVAEIVTPFLHYYDQVALHLGVVEERESDAALAETAIPLPAMRDRLAGIALSYSSTSEMPRSVSRSDGREMMLVAEDSDALPGSDYVGRAMLIDWKEFVRIGGEHVIALRGVAARGDNGIRPYNLGGIAKVNYLPQLFDTMPHNAPFNRRTFALRGYDEGLPQLTGTQMRMGSIEYRFPLWRLERGFMAPPVGLHQLHGSLFAETGSTWARGASPDKYYSSYGAELNADTVLFYGMMLRLSAGYAHGVEDIGGDHYYLRLGASF